MGSPDAYRVRAVVVIKRGDGVFPLSWAGMERSLMLAVLRPVRCDRTGDHRIGWSESFRNRLALQIRHSATFSPCLKLPLK